MRSLITPGCIAVLLMAAAAHGAIIDEFNDGSQVWSKSSSVSTLAESGGTLNATKNGGDPWLARTDFTTGVGNTFGSFESDANPYVHIRMTVPSGYSTAMQFFWGNPSTGFNGTQSSNGLSLVPGTTQTYVFDLASNEPTWTRNNIDTADESRITKFRVDPGAGTDGDGTTVNIDYIRVSNSATDSNSFGVDNFTDGFTDQWTFSPGMSSPTESGGTLQKTSTNGDPVMERNTVDFDGSLSTLVSVRLKVDTTAGQTAQVFYTTTTDDVFTGGKSAALPLITDGQFHTYTFDFSGDATWTGGTIARLRLDPTNVSGVAFEVDSISVIPEPATVLIVSAGLFGLSGFGRRRRRLYQSES